ncbi:hypothetical protein Tco_1204224 [Tanacetum coccineum]
MGMYNNKKVVDSAYSYANRQLCHGLKDLQFLDETRLIGTMPETVPMFTSQSMSFSKDMKNSGCIGISYQRYDQTRTSATLKKEASHCSQREERQGSLGIGKSRKAKEFETISKVTLTEAEQLKIITKRSRKETHSSHASGSGADEGTGVSTMGFPKCHLIMTQHDDISGNDDDDAKSGDDELKSQDDQDDDEAQTESEDDVDDFIHPKLTTHDDETTHEEETNEDDTFDP